MSRTRTIYKQAKDGEVIVPRMRGYKIRCCDCGLTHRVDFAVVRHGGRHHVAFKATRDVRATAAARREAKRRKQK